MAETKNGIKYPDNYDSVADIPKDLKDMAESIDAQIANKVEKVDGKGLSTNDFTNEYKKKLDGLNNYDDTKIKEDISNMQEEQETQNTDISTLKAEKEALEKEVERQKEDNKLNGLTEDNEGELVHIENSTGARFNSLEIEGNEKQENQDGTSNLLVLEEGSKSQDGITVTVENGEVTISGTATANTQLIIGKAYLHEGETYYIKKHGTSSNTGFRLQDSGSGTQHWFATSGESSFVAETTGEYDFYISTNSGQTSTATNLKLRVSKESGIEWEQGFINTPSFDYPSEIKAVEDNIHLKICNKNILDTNKINSTLSGVKIESDLDGSLNISGTPTKKFISIKSKIKLDYPIKAGTKISFLFGKSVYLQKDSELTPFLWASDENDNSAGNINTSSDDFSIIASRDVTNITWGIEGFDTSTNYNTKLYLMLVTGDITQNKYIQREEQNHVISVQQKMFAGDKFVKINGSWKEMHNWTEYEFDGTTEGFSMNWGDHVFGTISKKFPNQNQTKKAYSNRFKFDTREALMIDLKDGYFAMQKNFDAIYFKDESCSTAEEFIAKVVSLHEAGTPLKVVYKLNTPIELDCTDEQIEVLDKIEQEAHTYSEVTNVYTEDEVGAVLKTNTAVDLKTVINNVVEAQLEQIGG